MKQSTLAFFTAPTVRVCARSWQRAHEVYDEPRHAPPVCLIYLGWGLSPQIDTATPDSDVGV
jgi:hypothetical protein